MRVCAACGKENPQGARFCLGCGALLAQAAHSPEIRKTVTFVFSDLVGSTALAERLDPESVRQVMSRYFAETKLVLEKHGGRVEKFIGDAVMAVFGIPTVREDDALRAVRAAAEMHASLAELNEEFERQWGVTLAVRTGVNTGEVVAGDASAGQAFATGDAVNVAARLEQSAEPGEIRLGEATYRLVRSAVLAEQVQPFAAKGKAELLTAWRLLAVVEGAPTFPRRLDIPLVGREEELAALEDALRQAVEKRTCALCTVVGSAGIGKSRLAAEFLERVSSSATAHTGRCAPYGEGVTYLPLLEIVSSVTGAADRDAIRAALTDVADADVIADEIAAMLGLRGARGAGAGEEAFWAIRRLLETLARARPRVLVFEDIHWAESTLLDLIEYLLGWTTDAPVVVLCLARPDLFDERPQWPRGVASIELEPLSENESQALLEQLGANGALAPAMRARIADAAEGNPLFLEQMLAMLAEDPARGADAAVPPTIEALLAARLERLTQEERSVVERASVVGREFSRGAVVALTPDDARAAAGPVLLALTRKQLIAPDRSTDTRDEAFRFAHVLVRNAAYASIPKRTRADVHARLADWLERAAPEHERDELVGLHLEQSHRYRRELGPLDAAACDVGRRAAHRLAAAGVRALERGDAPATANLLGRADALLEPDEPARLELLPRLAAALLDSGDLARAEAVLAETADLADTAGDHALAARARLEHLYAYAHSRPAITRSEISELAERTIPILEAAGDEEGLARAWYLRSERDWFANRMGARAEGLKQALGYARRAADARGEAELVYWLALAIYTGPTPAREGIAQLEELTDQARTGRVVQEGVQALLAGFHAMEGRIDEARLLYRASRATFEDLGLMFRLALTTLLGAEVEVLAGDAAAAEAELRRGYDILAGMGETGTFSTVAGTLSGVVYVQGRYEEAERLAEASAEASAADDVYSHVLWRRTLAGVRARQGAADAAERLGREAIKLTRGTDSLAVKGDTLMKVAEVLTLLGRGDEVLPLVDEAIDAYDRKGVTVAAERARTIRRAGAAVSPDAG